MNAAMRKRLAAIEDRALGDALRELQAAVNMYAARREARGEMRSTGETLLAIAASCGVTATDRQGSPITAEAIDACADLRATVAVAIRESGRWQPSAFYLLEKWVERGGDHTQIVAAVVREFGHIAPPSTPPLALIGALAALLRGEFGRSGAVRS